MQALNLQAHHNAAAHSDEFVKEALVLHDKMSMLVVELLAYEVQRTENTTVLKLFLLRNVCMESIWAHHFPPT